MVSNDFLMQFQADILGVPVLRPDVAETTALGAAYLAGLAVGYWKDTQEIVQNWALNRRFSPSMDEDTRSRLYRGWQRAVKRVLAWEEAGRFRCKMMNKGGRNNSVVRHERFYDLLSRRKACCCCSFAIMGRGAGEAAVRAASASSVWKGPVFSLAFCRSSALRSRLLRSPMPAVIRTATPITNTACA